MDKIKQKQINKNAYFLNSGYLLQVAKDNYEKIGKDKKSTLICIIFSVIALESFINELLENAKIRSTNSRLTSKDERGKFTSLSMCIPVDQNLRLKYMLTKFILTDHCYKKEQAPYLNFNTLIQLRNEITHPNLDSFTFSKSTPREYPKIIKKLPPSVLVQYKDKNINSSWINLIQTSQMAHWAYNTTIEMIISIIEALPEGILKDTYDSFVKISFQKLS